MSPARALLDEAMQLHQAGRLPEAEQRYGQILESEPANVNALHLLGVLALQSGRPAEAADLIRRAVQLWPDFAEAHGNLGTALAQQGKLDEAVACWRRAVDLKPDYADGYVNLASALGVQGDLPGAAEAWGQAARLRPQDAEIHRRWGDALQIQGKLAESLGPYRQTLSLQSGHLAALNNLAYSLIGLKQPQEAANLLRAAIRLAPDYVQAHNNLGNACLEQGQLAEALACYQRALLIDPNYATAHNNVGKVFFERGELALSAASLEQALRLQPDFVDAHMNLANVRLGQGQLLLAEAGYRRALQLQPNHAAARGNLGMALLAMGKFTEGWQEYEFRHQGDASRPNFHLAEPLWDGSPLEGRTILLHAEQGFGDTLQFIRYARLLKQRGARVVLNCPAALIPLLRLCAGIDDLVPHGAPPPHFDVHAPLLSLPRLFGTTLASIPADVPYLSADPKLAARWAPEFSDRGRFRIGIAWQGRPTFRDDRWRSIPLAEFAPLAVLPGVQLFSLQKGHGSEQIPAVADRVPVFDLGSRLDEVSGAFMDTAAVIQHLDLVITSDTSIAHLAGALGAKVWVALAHVAEWRWLTDRDDSPWYPTMRLFRQPQPRDWPAVFQRMTRSVGLEFLQPNASRS